MEMLVLVMMIGLGAFWLKSRDQARRVALLGRHLMQFQIEKLMENLTQGYLRALGESDPERQAPIWAMLNAQERDLVEQFSRFATAFATVGEADARVSTLPVALPYASQLLPKATFDMRRALAVHARGIAEAVENSHGPDAQGQGLHPVGRAVPDAAHLPLVLPLPGRRLGALAGAAPDFVRTGAGSCSAVDAPGLRGRDRSLTEVASRPGIGWGHSGVDQ
jgi:hypothetical protein